MEQKICLIIAFNPHWPKKCHLYNCNGTGTTVTNILKRACRYGICNKINTQINLSKTKTLYIYTVVRKIFWSFI